MTDSNVQFISHDKLEELKNELDDLQKNKIPSLAQRIDDARQLGDLSENAEYHAAREEMAWAQSHVLELNYIIENSVLMNKTKPSGKVQISSKIKVKFGDKTREYTIVGAQEADPAAGKISNESPLGTAFLGHKVGDKIEIRVPAGIQVYEIIEIL